MAAPSHVGTRPADPSSGVRPLALVRRNLMANRRAWVQQLGAVFEPVLYLLAFGIGLGQMIGHAAGTGPGISYSVYVAPALLATTAMNSSMNETSYGLFDKVRSGVLASVVSTPMSVGSIVVGEVCWAVLRGVAASAGFLVIVAACGLVHSPWVLLALPGAAVVAFAFASLGVAVVTCARSFQDFQLLDLFMLPMFLFATTFYPLGTYPRPLQILIECLPLYQGIEVVRRPALGDVGPSLLVPAAYLATFGSVLLLVGGKRMKRTLTR